MKLKALNAVKIGGVNYRTGSSFDCPDEEATRLLMLGAAEPVSDLLEYDPDSLKKPEIISKLEEMEDVDFDPSASKPELLSLLKAELAKRGLGNV